jgi:hypothetical protein
MRPGKYHAPYSISRISSGQVDGSTNETGFDGTCYLVVAAFVLANESSSEIPA